MSNQMSILKQISWRRLIWVVFLILYLSLFFFNFLSPEKNWHVAYVYTMFFVIWLCVEYYERHLFFQTGLLGSYSWPLRVLFALFFYSSFIIGLVTIVWWDSNRIGLYPFLQILGVLLLLYSIYMRRKAFMSTVITEKYITTFYYSLYFLTMSIAFAYGSLFLIPYVLIIGFPLIALQTRYEKKHFGYFREYVNKALNIDTIKAKRYRDLWNKYSDHLQKKQKRKKK
jgi:hypothetical protein